MYVYFKLTCLYLFIIFKVKFIFFITVFKTHLISRIKNEPDFKNYELFFFPETGSLLHPHGLVFVQC
jgi:hypothetical protein